MARAGNSPSPSLRFCEDFMQMINIFKDFPLTIFQIRVFAPPDFSNGIPVYASCKSLFSLGTVLHTCNCTLISYKYDYDLAVLQLTNTIFMKKMQVKNMFHDVCTVAICNKRRIL